jgi:Glycosyl transferase family 2
MTEPQTAQIDVLVPTKDRPTELAATLAGLAAQTGVWFRVVVSDQSDGPASYATPAAQTLVRALRRRGTAVELCSHLPRRGITEHRSFLLSKATAPAVLFLDDDVWLEAGVLPRLHGALRALDCGFVAAAMQGLSHLEDRRPDECAPFDRIALLDVGGFDSWRWLPADAHGEDVLVQLRVMARRGGAGVLPSGAYHQQSPTSIPTRSTSAVDALSVVT